MLTEESSLPMTLFKKVTVHAAYDFEGYNLIGKYEAQPIQLKQVYRGSFCKTGKHSWMMPDKTVGLSEMWTLLVTRCRGEWIHNDSCSSS